MKQLNFSFVLREYGTEILKDISPYRAAEFSPPFPTNTEILESYLTTWNSTPAI
jgi:hypothetical protein